MNATDPAKRLNAALGGRYRTESELSEGGMDTVYLDECSPFAPARGAPVSANRRCFTSLAALTLTLFAASCKGSSEVCPPTDALCAVSTTAVPTTVTVSPASVSASSLGETQMLNATVRDQLGQAMASASVTWSSSLTGVATVSPAGLVTAVSNGDATITAVSGAANGSASVTVQQVVAAITVSPSAVVMAGAGATATVVASVTDAGGSVITNPTLTWSSGDQSVVTVSAGIVTAVAIGATTVSVESVGGVQALFTVSVTANPAVAVITPSLPDGVTGVAYSRTLLATGGDGSYTWALAMGSGSLPSGLTLETTGDITGTPTTAGIFDFTVEVTSGDGQTDTQELTINVSVALVVLTGSLPSGSTGAAYSQTLLATGGDGSYTWALAMGSGSLPSGLTLETTGDITGTPTVAGTTSFVVEVASGAATAQKVLSITVNAGTLIVTTISLPDGGVGLAYSETLLATGGDGTYSWGLAAGSATLPTGLSLATSGAITGTPSVAGRSDFTVEVTSGLTQTAVKELSIAVANPLILYDDPFEGSIDPITDIDSFRFNADVGTRVRIHSRGTGIGDMRLQIREPLSNPTAPPLIELTCEGDTGRGCQIVAEFVPAVSGFFALILSERDGNDTGSYQFNLVCLVGPCDSDGDGVPDPQPPLVSYDTPVDGSLDLLADFDLYRFNAAAGTRVQIDVRGIGFGDLRVGVRDPQTDPTLPPLFAETCEGNPGTGCRIVSEFVPAISGFHTLFVSERDVNETGRYQFNVVCMVGTCPANE